VLNEGLTAAGNRSTHLNHLPRKLNETAFFVKHDLIVRARGNIIFIFCAQD
jgi:hypothetical protein